MQKIKVIPLLEIIFKNKGGTSELWKSIIELLNTRENEIPVFSSYIKHKINSYNKDNSLLALDLIDFCVDYGKMYLWSNLNSKDFLSSFITNLKTREDCEIQTKILFLIEKWGKKFSKYPNLPNFQNIYILLKSNNVEFPSNIKSEYSKYAKYLNLDEIDYEEKSNINYNAYNNNVCKKETDPENYLRDINLDLNTSSYEKKYKRLVNKLYDWTHDIHEINVLINKNIQGINNNKIAGLIKEISTGNKQLIETIQSGKLKDKTLMNISLNVASDINMTLKRWSNHKKGVYPNPFISSFFQNENMEINDNQPQKISSSYNNYFENTFNNSIDIKNFYNINNNSTYVDNKNLNNNKISEKYNNNSFNLLVDFECIPVSNNNWNNTLNNSNLNLKNEFNINNIFDLMGNKKENEVKKSNILNNEYENNFNYMNNTKKIKNNINFDCKNIDNIENSSLDINNDNLSRQSLMYPSFEELNQQ